MTELLVNVSMRFPAEVDQYTLSALLAPVVRAAVAAGGLTTNLSVAPFDASPDAEPSSLGSVIVQGEGAADATPPAIGPVQPCASWVPDAQGCRVA